MTRPHPDLDICYSRFSNNPINVVPVVRIFGTTPAAQKGCLHVHKAFPYLFIMLDPSVGESEDDVNAHLAQLGLSIEKALNLNYAMHVAQNNQAPSGQPGNNNSKPNPATQPVQS